jgi:type IV pilus assembly protein PilN
MMIRINLLPVRQVQKREAGRQFIVLMVGTLIIAGAGNGFWFSDVTSKRDAAQRKLDDTNARIAQLEKVIGEVNNLARRKKEVEEKLSELNKLLTERKGPVKLLDALSTAIPKKVWLLNFEERGGQALINGFAESYDDVSIFMRALKNVAWTPKGMARVVERKRDNQWRVESISSEGAIEEFTRDDVKVFFDNIELKDTATDGARAVKFQLSMTANMKL